MCGHTLDVCVRAVFVILTVYTDPILVLEVFAEQSAFEVTLVLELTHVGAQHYSVAHACDLWKAQHLSGEELYRS